MSCGNGASFFKSKFDNICLLLLMLFLVSLLTWTDKHNNSDYVKWLEVFTAGIGGAYLGLITASRQAWEKKIDATDGTTTTTTTSRGGTSDPTAVEPPK